MNDSQPRAFTANALLSLKTALEDSTSPQDFLATAGVIAADPKSVLELPNDYGRPDPLVTQERGSGRDIGNGPAVYEFLGALDPANASDPRLWSYLALVTYRPYMDQRWTLEEGKNWKGRVQDRWLLLNSSRGALIRHGIARLWWVSALTYDPKQEFPLSKQLADPFAYTKAAFRNEDRVIGLFDREAGSVGSLVRAVLEQAASDPKAATDSQIRRLMKEVTLVYGFRDLEVLDDSEIRALVEELSSAL